MTASAIRSPQDFAAGAVLCAIAVAGLWFGRHWETGTLANVGSGLFPRLICILLLGFGGYILIRSLQHSGASLSGWAWRPLLAVTASMLAFAVTIERAGLVVAVAAVVVVGSLAGAPLGLIRLAALVAVLAFLCTAMFIWGLGLPLQVWP